MLVATNIFCRDKHDFVATKVLSQLAYFCRDKRRVLSRQTRVCSDKTFVATKIILVAAPANNTKGGSAHQGRSWASPGGT